MMNEVFYKELRNSMHQMREEITDVSEIEGIFLDSIRELTRLLIVARREGLLQLDVEIEEESVSNLKLRDDLVWLIEMVTNGVDEDMFENLGLVRYYSKAYCGWKGVLYLMYLEVAFFMKHAELPYVMKLMVEALFPDSIGKNIGSLIDGWETDCITNTRT